jgi:hypothetical protein
MLPIAYVSTGNTQDARGGRLPSRVFPASKKVTLFFSVVIANSQKRTQKSGFDLRLSSDCGQVTPILFKLTQVTMLARIEPQRELWIRPPLRQAVPYDLKH